MTESETQRIAILTTGAIKTTTESAVKAMMAALEAAEDKIREMREVVETTTDTMMTKMLIAVRAAEEKTKEMREATEQFVTDSERVTNALADHVDSHVKSCQAAIDTFQEHHLKILNGDAQVPAPQMVEVDHVVSKDELDDLKALALSSVKAER